jgi:hypothetical protein
MKFPFVKKPSVKVSGLNPVYYTQVFIDCIVDAYREFMGPDYQVVVTSAVDGKHSKHSRHYLGEAIDTRIIDVPQDVRGLVCLELSWALGDKLPGFDFHILHEKDHLHIQIGGTNINPEAEGLYRG